MSKARTVDIEYPDDCDYCCFGANIEHALTDLAIIYERNEFGFWKMFSVMDRAVAPRGLYAYRVKTTTVEVKVECPRKGREWKHVSPFESESKTVYLAEVPF